MSISDNIRLLARDGLSTADIARRLGIRYQHAYNVLKASATTGTVPKVRTIRVPPTAQKPPLTTDALVAGGFALSSRWLLSKEGNLVLETRLPKVVGVYAFAKDGIVLYVGVATMGLAKRLYFYGKPGITQRTSQRLNTIIKNELMAAPAIDIYTAAPPDLHWNGLPIHGSSGLELGLIKKFALPWNMRSAR